jgi:uncharacterized protein YcnI
VRPSITTAILTLLVLLLWAGPAAAHAGLVPGDLAPGVRTESELVLVHGCGPDGTIPGSDDAELPTTGVTLERPDGLSLVPREADGWTLTTEEADDGELVRARWEADDPAGALGTVFLGVEVTADEALDGQDVWVPVLQDCVDGERLAWTHLRADGGDRALPAMLVSVDSAVLAAEAASSGGGLPTSVVATLAVALAVVAGGGVAAVTARRG